MKQCLNEQVLNKSSCEKLQKEMPWTGPESTWTSCGKMVKNCKLVMNKLWIGHEQDMNKGVNKLRTSP